MAGIFRISSSNAAQSSERSKPLKDANPSGMDLKWSTFLPTRLANAVLISPSVTPCLILVTSELATAVAAVAPA